MTRIYDAEKAPITQSIIGIHRRAYNRTPSGEVFSFLFQIPLYGVHPFPTISSTTQASSDVYKSTTCFGHHRAFCMSRSDGRQRRGGTSEGWNSQTHHLSQRPPRSVPLTAKRSTGTALRWPGVKRRPMRDGEGFSDGDKQ